MNISSIEASKVGAGKAGKRDKLAQTKLVREIDVVRAQAHLDRVHVHSDAHALFIDIVSTTNTAHETARSRQTGTEGAPAARGTQARSAGKEDGEGEQCRGAKRDTAPGADDP
jgi:hypothetical protein